MLMFWVTDNFLMYKDPSKRRRHSSSEESLLQKGRIKYRFLRRKKKTDPESDVLLSGDDDLLDSETVPINRTVVT